MYSDITTTNCYNLLIISYALISQYSLLGSDNYILFNYLIIAKGFFDF